MAEVTWINGTIDPPQSGVYYVAFEAKHNMIMLDEETGKEHYEKGDVKIEVDFYDAKGRVWKQLGKDNPFWAVLCWAHILEPDLPNDIRERLVEYFGEKVQCKNGDWCTDGGRE